MIKTIKFCEASIQDMKNKIVKLCQNFLMISVQNIYLSYRYKPINVPAFSDALNRRRVKKSCIWKICIPSTRQGACKQGSGASTTKKKKFAGVYSSAYIALLCKI